MENQKTIGIVGGGQLGRMMTLAALPLGFKVVVVNPSLNGPAAQVGAEEIIGDLYDPIALKKLAEKADYITVEIEHLDTKTLAEIAANGTPVNPAPATIEMIQDKYLQKEFLQKAGIPLAPFIKIDNIESAKKALTMFSGKMVVKTRHGAYDGRGNMVVKTPEDIEKAFELFNGQKLYAEGFVPFVQEVAIMVARSMHGDIALYPLVETIHERNICLEVLAPAPVSDDTKQQAEDAARKVAALLQGAGTFGIEMFVTADGSVLINEIAPRVHNSGHHTIEATRTSQFEQHIRAITGLPLGETDLIVPAAAMINILGERDGPTVVEGLSEALEIPGVSVHLYGKFPTKVDRKMGHITATAATLDEARERAQKARELFSI